VNFTELLLLIAALPAPGPLICRRNGSTAVAFVELSTFADVSCSWKISASGSLHSAWIDDPLKPVPMNITTVPGQPEFGVTDVRCDAEAAWALPRNTIRPSVPAIRDRHPVNLRPSARGSAVVACTASLC
jgi:hypothetical protein